MFKKVRRYYNDPYYEIGYDLIKHHPKLMSDKYYLSVLWKIAMGYELDWKNPKTFNEKLQWLKLHDRNPLYTTLVDKYRVKQWVANKIGEQYVIPTLAVYNSADEIDLEQLPNQFVLKCNHDSGSVVICRDKSTFDFETAKKKLDKAMNNNFYWEAREWPYKDVIPMIIIEEFKEDFLHDSLVDYKFFCFDVVPRLMYLSEGLDNHQTARMSFFDMDFNLTNCRRTDYKPLCYKPVKPLNFELMKYLAEQLSRGIPQIRVDFYEICGRVYFGELTFFTNGGMIPFENVEWDLRMGDWIKLPKD